MVEKEMPGVGRYFIRIETAAIISARLLKPPHPCPLGAIKPPHPALSPSVGEWVARMVGWGGSQPRRGWPEGSGEGVQSNSWLFVQALAVTDIELLELAIQMGALQTGSLRHPGHAAAFFLDQVFKIKPFESVARFA